MRWIGLALVVILLVVGFAAYSNPASFPAGIGDRLPGLIWLGLALLLVTGAGFGFTRLRAQRRLIVPALLFWAGALLLITFLYNLAH